MSDKESILVSNVRVFSMGWIIFSHFLQGSNNTMLNSLAQWDVVAVFIFMFIAGYLQGRKDTLNFWSFVINRWVRLMIPIYIYFIFIAIVTFIFKTNYLTGTDLLTIISGIFAFNPIKGGAHLWFITILLICNILTPLFVKFKKSFQRINKYVLLSIVLLFIIIEGLLFLRGVKWEYLEYLVSIFVYFAGFFYHDYLKTRYIDYRNYLAIVILALVTFMLKVKFYSVGIILFSHCAMMINYYLLCIATIESFYFISGVKKYLVVKYIEQLSYYLYIVHPLVIWGPVLIIYYQSSFKLLIVALVVIMTMAVFLEIISNKIISEIQKFSIF